MLLFDGGFKIKGNITLDKLSSSIRRALENYSTETLSTVKDVEMVYIAQSDLCTFQLIFKDSMTIQQTTPGMLFLKISWYNLLYNFYSEKVAMLQLNRCSSYQ